MCPAKRSCGSDITLGDFWGFQGIHPEVDYSKGVSAVICNTDKGIAAFQGIANSIDCGDATIEQVLAGNPSLVKSVARMRSAMSLWQILLQGWVSRD